MIGQVNGSREVEEVELEKNYYLYNFYYLYYLRYLYNGEWNVIIIYILIKNFDIFFNIKI